MKRSEACCARLEGRIVREESEQRRAARAASARKSNGLDLTPKMIADLEKAASGVEHAKQSLSDHTAEHANDEAAA